MIKKTSLAFRLLIFFCSVAALQAQQLRIEYPQIRLSDKRVLAHARVESFNGLGFCIAHDTGIEGFVDWEIMPPDWQKAFPRNPQLALEIADKARAAEAKLPPPPPIDLKKHTGRAVAAADTADAPNQDKPSKSSHPAAARAPTAPEWTSILAGKSKADVLKLLGGADAVYGDGDALLFYNKAYSSLKQSNDTILEVHFSSGVVSSVGLNGEQRYSAREAPSHYGPTRPTHYGPTEPTHYGPTQP